MGTASRPGGFFPTIGVDMTAFPSRLTVCLALGIGAALSSPVRAEISRSWVATSGSGTACTQAAPCATFSQALTATMAGGLISCVDNGFFGNPTITKSIVIDCEGIGAAVFTTEITLGSNESVTLRGLNYGGFDDGFPSPNVCGLISFAGAGTLHLDKVKLSHVGSMCNGLLFKPTGPARLNVSNSYFANIGTDVAAAAILIAPTGGGSANVSVDSTQFKNNFNAVYLNGALGGGPVNLSVRESVITNSGNVGIVVASSGQAYSALIERTTIASSLNVGAAVSGGNATMRLDNSTIYGNVRGVLAINGGNLRSYRNNRINGNGTDGTPIAAADVLN
jgi:hypothetical protein